MPPYDSDEMAWQSESATTLKFIVKVWKGRQVLKVYFMNPEVLEGWKCEGKKMTTEMIMEWANAWEQAPSAPQFKATSNVKIADIRVKFSGSLNFPVGILYTGSYTSCHSQTRKDAGLWWAWRLLTKQRPQSRP